MRVRDVLHVKGDSIITISDEATAQEAVAAMVEDNIGSLPVVDCGGLLVGIISERDLLREIHDRGNDFGQTPIRAIMTLQPVTCDIEDILESVMGLMTRDRIAKVPVTEEGHLVGIISVGDVIKRLYESTRAENGHILEYLHGTAIA